MSLINIAYAILGLLIEKSWGGKLSDHFSSRFISQFPQWDRNYKAEHFQGLSSMFPAFRASSVLDLWEKHSKIW